jgi:hypothetical protein
MSGTGKSLFRNLSCSIALATLFGIAFALNAIK